nr:hypothetical protein [Tanacetum cinerariifolium]
QAAFAENCAGCHGPSGTGDGLAAPTLLPRPANLRDAQFTTRHLADVLWNGRPGTAMPAWRDLDNSTLGNGPASRGLSPRPANFWEKKGNTAYLENVLREGIPGTAMPPWKAVLSDEQRTAVVTYLRTLYQPTEQE